MSEKNPEDPRSLALTEEEAPDGDALNLAHFYNESSRLNFTIAKIGTLNARLPEVYETACAALVECEQIDECKDWADKAEALASYARQAKNKTLLETAQRIQVRALRRCGELIREIEPKSGARTDLEPDAAAGTRSQAARDAGLSPRQQATTLRIASVPAEQFEVQVESSPPPTATEMAEAGTARREPPVRWQIVEPPDQLTLQERMVLARMATTLTQLHKLFLKARKIDSTKIVNAADAGFLTKLIAWMTEIRDAKDPAAEPAPEHPDDSADPAEPDQRELAALARMMSADQVAEAFPYHGGYGVGMMTKVERDIYGPQPTAEQAAAAAQPEPAPTRPVPARPAPHGRRRPMPAAEVEPEPAAADEDRPSAAEIAARIAAARPAPRGRRPPKSGQGQPE